MIKIGTIIGIDPGSTNLGLGHIQYDLDTFRIIKTDAFTIRADRSEHYTEVSKYHSDKQQRLKALEEHLYDVFIDLQPDLIASESPFYNRFRPNAYGVLVETIDSIKAALWRYDNKSCLMTIDPPSVKKGVGTNKLTGKDPVRDAVRKLTNLNIVTPIDHLDEHSIDAVAVAYCAYKNFLGAIHNE